MVRACTAAGCQTASSLQRSLRMPPGILAATGMLLVAALTPGPNNLVVLRTAARGDLAAVSSAIAGIVLGGVLMLVVVTVAADAMPAGWTSLLWVVASAGAVYLCWLGVGMLLWVGSGGDGMRTYSVDRLLPIRTP